MSLSARISALSQVIGEDVKELVSGVQALESALSDKLSTAAYEFPATPKRLLVYYGYPVAYQGLWDAQQVANEIASKYDIYICGDTYQDPNHESYADTQLVIAELIAQGVEVWGYIPLGMNSYGLTISEITTRVADWNALGVTGIFIDEFGFEYGSSRQRQINAVNACHNAGLPYCANAWTWEDVSVDHVDDLPAYWATDDWRYVNWTNGNPDNLPLPRNSTDGYLMENWGMDSNGPTTKWDFHERAILTKAANPDGMRLWGLSVMPEAPDGTLDTTLSAPFETAEEVNLYTTVGGMIHGLDSVGVNGYSFGSAGDTNFVTKRVMLPEPFRGTQPAPATFNTTTGEARRYFGSNALVCLTDELTGAYSWDVDLKEDLESVQYLKGKPATIQETIDGVAGKYPDAAAVQAAIQDAIDKAVNSGGI